MISPLLITSTLQPISSPRASIYPILCRVARLTIASPMIQGDRIATGETAPDLPTFHSTSNSSVTTPACLFLRANAPRGWCDV